MKLHITEEWCRRMAEIEEECDPGGILAAGGLFNDERSSSMHYRNGREAKNGDMIVQISYDGALNAVGILYGATPGNDYCNGLIAPVTTSGACLCDCLHMDDIIALLKEKGLDKRPEGK